MKGGFTKLHGSLLTSSLWMESKATRLVWIAMLASKDAEGHVTGSVPGLANVANVTVEECEEALQVLSSPDPYSRTPDHEGRRIEKCDGGWMVLNHFKYRDGTKESSRRYDAPGYVYAVQRVDGTGNIKIGFSANPWARASQLQTGSDTELMVIATKRGTRSDEYELHRAFEQDRVTGEWFRPSDRVLAWVAENANRGKRASLRKARGGSTGSYRSNDVATTAAAATPAPSPPHPPSPDPETDAETDADADLGNASTSSQRSLVDVPTTDQASSRSRGGGRKSKNDPVAWIWDWFEAECIAAGFGRRPRKLSDSRRARIGTLLKHIRQTLGCDLKGALASQRKHLLYRIAEARAGEHQAKKRLRSETPWRTGNQGTACWWDWWFTNIEDAPTSGPAGGAEPRREITPDDALRFEADTGQLPPGWRRIPGAILAPNGDMTEVPE